MKSILVLSILSLLPLNALLAQDCVIISGNHTADMTYHDFIPDTVVKPFNYQFSSDTFDIDLNYDAIPDFKIEAKSHQGNGGGIHRLIIWPYNGNEINLRSIDSLDIPTYGMSYYHTSEAFELGDTIKSTDSFTTSHVYLHYYYYYDGWNGFLIDNWKGLGDRFLGIKMNINGEMVCGWIRLNVTAWSSNSYPQVTVDDFALSQFFEPIFDAPQVFPNPAFDELNVRFPSLVSDGEISIIDVQGKVCSTISIDNSALEVIDISHLQQGVYFVQSHAYNETYIEKIVKL